MLNRTLLTLLLAALSLPASADLRVNATRVVREQGSTAATSIRVHNIGNDPSLIQAWVDEGNGELPLEALRTPYVVTPPLFRLDAGESRDIQIREADTRTLPRDRESLLWLNITDVPSRRAGANAPALEFAMRWRLKVFHRPAGLAGRPEEAPGALRWSVTPGTGGPPVLHAANPTPYYVSLAGLRLGQLELSLDAGNAQIPPHGHWSLILGDAVASSDMKRPLTVTWVDDRGIEHTLQCMAEAGTTP